jgi:hypothetical protein
MTEPTYPFLFLNHGPIDPEAIGKCEELWMWFSRDVTPAERKKIQKRAPAPLSCFLGWDRRFAYFGSAGDSYDGEVISKYGPPELVARIEEATRDEQWDEVATLYGEAMEHLDEAVVAFAADVDRWAKEVHAIVPLVVFYGPHGGGGDGWHEHSKRALGRTMLPLFAEYRADAAGETYLGYIKRLVNAYLGAHADEIDLGDLRPGMLAALDDTCRTTELRVPFERLLSSSDAPIQSLGVNVAQALEGLPDAERRAWLERLGPLARLAYLASYSAAGTKDLDRVGDLPAYLRALIAELPAERAHLAPWFVLWTAETLAQDTCAFDKKKRDTSRAGDAVRVLDVALALPGATAPMWAEAVRYRSWAGQHEDALATAQRGLAAFPYDRLLATEAVAAAKVARKGKKPTKADRASDDAFAEALAQSRTLDPDAFVAKTAALAGKGKLAELFKLFQAYLAAGAQLAPGAVCNGLYPIIEGVVPEPAFGETTFPRLIEAALGSRAFRLHEQAIVQVGIVLDKFPQHRPLFVRLGMPHVAEPGAGLHAQLLWHAHAVGDAAAVETVMAALDTALAADPEHLDRQTYTLENLAEFALARGDKARALGYLERLKRADVPRFQKTQTEEGFRALHGDPAFQALFGKAKRKKA